jgi:hypothetical protein
MSRSRPSGLATAGNRRGVQDAWPLSRGCNFSFPGPNDTLGNQRWTSAELKAPARAGQMAISINSRVAGVTCPQPTFT